MLDTAITYQESFDFNSPIQDILLKLRTYNGLRSFIEDSNIVDVNIHIDVDSTDVILTIVCSPVNRPDIFLYIQILTNSDYSLSILNSLVYQDKKKYKIQGKSWLAYMTTVKYSTRVISPEMRDTFLKLILTPDSYIPSQLIK